PSTSRSNRGRDPLNQAWMFRDGCSRGHATDTSTTSHRLPVQHRLSTKMSRALNAAIRLLFRMPVRRYAAPRLRCRLRRRYVVTKVSTNESSRVSQQWVERYLTFLGVPEQPPSVDALSRLTRAHLSAVVFENITSLLRRREHGTPVPELDPEVVLADWEAGR